MATVWMQKWADGEPDPTVAPKEVEATPKDMLPLMNAGWHQCAAPAKKDKEATNANAS